MKINRFREPGLSEDYIDIHYREYNDEIRRIVDLAAKEPMLLGKQEGEQVFLKPEEVYYFEAVDRKCFACLEEEVFQVEQGIQAVSEKYSELGFIRISKSIVVNIYKIRKIKADVNMKMQLVLDNGEKVILNRSYKNDFLKFIRERRNEHATH